MLTRLALILCFSFFMSASMATTVVETETKANNEELTQTVFELERSVAILQLSKASLDDYQIMSEKMAHIESLESRVDFFAVLTFLLCLALVVLFVQVRNQHKRLSLLELDSKM
ncbi:hypothetical protein MUS1_02560 [Marinomonas ushuaiensis DSM 15871]|uniref:Diguanylate cyclase n=1 Tax=Marinomonas ushuaiensis DSM 15871 TaxID=1122207 RepID=X7E9C5_9GAMM|nr:hypothetical protein [Marinomonas ushuaiensis]ETX12699.1 hypothetical protein MUS1_02560 [Marinomonas ushuaiensis DSM 15871]